MDWLHLLLLAIVQGLTEFLPISSSGHLVIAEHLLGMETDLALVNVILHAGTLGSILVFYRRNIFRLLSADRHVIWLLAIGTVPAVVCGLAIELFFSELVESPLVAGLMLPVTGVMLLWLAGRDGKLDYANISYRQALLIGLFQAFALLPGISRSGATIVAGSLTGLRKSEAATFSFLLAIPAILLATVWKMRNFLTESEPSMNLGVLLMGAVTSLLVGLFALWAVVRVLNQGRLHWFAWWCVPLGIATVSWILWGSFS